MIYWRSAFTCFFSTINVVTVVVSSCAARKVGWSNYTSKNQRSCSVVSVVIFLLPLFLAVKGQDGIWKEKSRRRFPRHCLFIELCVFTSGQQNGRFLCSFSLPSQEIKRFPAHIRFWLWPASGSVWRALPQAHGYAPAPSGNCWSCWMKEAYWMSLHHLSFPYLFPQTFPIRIPCCP